MKNQIVLAAAAGILLAAPLAHSQEFIAYQIDAGQAGNQSAGASLGLDFNSAGDITVNRLGCFDDDADGLINTITVELWSRDDGGTPEDRTDDFEGAMLASASFDAGAPGTLEGGHRFKDLAGPVNLAAGAYTIVAYGFGADDRNFNTNTAPGLAPLSEEGAGVLDFIGRRFGASGTFPGTSDGGVAARYAAGTFAFELLDSDSDGMPDFWEDLFSLDKNDAGDATGDLDGDSLNNLAEYTGGTNPEEEDTDFDGANDDVEIANGTDPVLEDSDFDGLLDGSEDDSGTFGDEENTGTDPLVVDTDADGYDDGAEVELLSDPTDGAATPINTFGEPAYALAKGLVGNQAAPGALGMDFVIDGKVSIGYLGAFDEGSDGFTNPMTVEIWERDDAGTPEDPTDDTGVGIDPIVRLVIEPGEGFLQGSNRFKALATPLVLDSDVDASNYTIVAHGFSADDRNFNIFGGLPENSGLSLASNIAVQFVGRSRFSGGGGAGSFPPTADSGPANRYAAGTFAFTTEDADGDGMPDFWELMFALNPNSAADATLDGDGDDLSNLDEFLNDLDPTDADTDDDDLNDGAELVAMTDPKNPDTDGDTLTDGAEVLGGTSPLLVDTDGDDFTDNREIAEGTDPTDEFEFPVATPTGSLAYLADVGSVGNQTNFGGSAGMDFVVNDTVIVTELGAFDSAGDGFGGEITVQLWSRDDFDTPDDFGDDTGDTMLGQVVFGPGNRGDLRDGHRTQALASAVVLQPGSYTIVANGFGLDDPMGNAGFAEPPVLATSTGSALSFVGSGRFLGGAPDFPTNADAGPANRYAAGTFAFEIPSDESGITDFTWDPISETGSISFVTVPNESYEVQYSVDLAAGSWSGIDDLEATAGETTFPIDSNPAPGAERVFFRAIRLE